ncbi:MAG: hypothetical protein V4577_16810 [Bacteroidota bacterium]
MKQFTLKLVIPLTIISFVLITKWWYVQPEDAPDSMLKGFPFPYSGNGWWTSMSFQYFVLEFIADLLVYFVFWFLLIALINRYLKPIKIHKAVTIILWCISSLMGGGAIFIAGIMEHDFKLIRDFKMEVLDTGHEFLWEFVDHRGDYEQYRLKEKTGKINESKAK